MYRRAQSFKPGSTTSAALAPVLVSALLSAGAIFFVPSAFAQAVDGAPSTDSLKKLSLDELMSIEVTSVSKTAEPLSKAAAAIYVITREDILRSGATSIPEMLRLAPNLQVARTRAQAPRQLRWCYPA